MAAPWSKPVTQTLRGTEVWTAKTLPTPPPTWTDYLPVHHGAHGPATQAAALSFKCPSEHFDRWCWVVRIFSRNLAPFPHLPCTVLDTGVKQKATWSQATAWFARDAHTAGTPAQYLLTAAHNFLNPVYSHDNDGKVTSMGTMEQALADAVFVVATLGSSVFTGWVDRVSVMTGYFDNKNDLRNDGAALHIENSKIPSELYTNAPRIVSLPPPMPAGGDPPPGPNRWNFPFVVAGFPAAINRFADLAGLYIGGVRNAGAVAAAVADFGPVMVSKNIVTAQLGPKNINGTITWNADQVNCSQRLSGSPGVLLIPSVGEAGTEEVVICSLNTNGIGAGFAKSPLIADPLSVDPVSLLYAVDSLDMEWFQWNTLCMPAAGNWWALRRSQDGTDI
ncbi:MAG: hypothetical protein L6R38_006997 [Xanthoria sp. 2 TBL-2021]|nr:MAG: hypothetical protein L6R38_006997 [Xanthoria sp. 2 TBL-2021]